MCEVVEYNGLIRREECVLVIIDAQERLMPVISNKTEVTDNIVRLARFARIVGIPVIVTEQEKLGWTLPEIRDCLAEYSPVSKVHFNCFGCDDFRDRVARLGKRTLILTGVEAHICVTQTALGCAPSCTAHVVSDAVSSRAPANREVAIKRMTQSGAVLTSTEMFIYEILEKAGTDEFRAALPLVK